MALLFVLLLLQVDPADQLRRQELALRLSELADAEKPDGFVRAVQRELRGPRIDPGLYADCWRPVVRRRVVGQLDALIAAWDKAAIEAPTPARLLYRAKLEDLASRPKVCREKLEEAGKKFPTEPTLLWHLGKARYEAGDRGPAATAFEQMASQKGAEFEVEEFHKLLVVCYAETGRPAAAIEHLRACRDEESYTVPLARLAAQSKLFTEAARLYGIAAEWDPERLSVRLELIAALTAAGEEAQATAARAPLLQTDGKYQKNKLRDYFLLLPPSGRAEEIVRTLREIPEQELLPLLASIPGECEGGVAAVWERQIRSGRDWSILFRMKETWSGTADVKESLAKAESQFPKDAYIAREKIEILARHLEFKDALAAYDRLLQLDPEAKLSGPRPFAALQETLADQALKDVPSALAMALHLLAEPGAGEAEARAIRAALKPGWDLSATDYWTQLRKTPLPKPPKAVVEKITGQIERLSADDFNDRAEAGQQLRKAGLPGIPVLLERIDDPDAEIRSRCREAIRAILTD
jgi:tetratricopeptide (TPR) repeat protein